jgi:hypothetical protein
LANLIGTIYRSRDIYRGNTAKISRQESSRGSSSCLQYRGNVVLQHECLPRKPMCHHLRGIWRREDGGCETNYAVYRRRVWWAG